MEDEPPPPNRATTSIDNTVFVRFVPPNASIRRHHVLDLFSEVGPIKKSSIIHATDPNNSEITKSSYGFIRYTNAEDASLAAIQLNNKTLKVQNNQEIVVKVELAQKGAKELHGDHKEKTLDPKKTNRLIVRNLSFFATEKDVRKVLSKFGTLTEIHIPMVQNTRRGFCFVQFEERDAVEACLKAENVVIRDRPVSISRALHKKAHQQQDNLRKHHATTNNNNIQSDETQNEEGASPDQRNNNGSDSEDEETHSTSRDKSSGDSSRDSGSEESDHAEEESGSHRSNQAVAEQRCLFLRNLPFDVTRHDIFEEFRKYGHIDAIYIVKDRETGKIPRGTAFVTYQTPEQAAKALADSGQGSESSSTSITLKGRNIYADLAVDKETATTLSEKKTIISKDRRNLYLKGEGRVDNTETDRAWDELPEADQLKRQTAWSDKNTKLKSPLFFINPKRLSVRNLGKHVDEAQFKQLIIKGVQTGLKKNLVTIEDQIAHWKASGEMTSTEILEEAHKFHIPKLDDKNIRDCIPSVHIHRDYPQGGNKNVAPSRGFGFVEFQHHLHALACLRELNNNTKYTTEYAAGGKFSASKQLHQQKASKRKRDNEAIKIPRLIVEFTVENKAKAKQQEQHKAQQRANCIKQKHQSYEEKTKQQKKRKSRGAEQREKKRRLKEQVGTDGVASSGESKVELASTTRPTVQDNNSHLSKSDKPRRPPKKQPKTDEAEEKFAMLVDKYKLEAVSLIGGHSLSSAAVRKKDKRWFE